MTAARKLNLGVSVVGLLLIPSLATAYPIDGYNETGIARLEAYRLAQAGKITGPKLAPGALLQSADITLRLIDQPDFLIPPSDSQWNAKLRGLLGDEADRYGVAILDLTDPAQPHYGEHRASTPQNPGSVGKVAVLLALFQKLADLYPDDIEARRRVLRESRIIADGVIQTDSHTVPFWKPGDVKIVKRRLAEGDDGNLWTYLDWMASSSSNAAASVAMQQLVLLAHFGKQYPVDGERARAFWTATTKGTLNDIFLDAMTLPITRNGLDLKQLRQGSFFTRAGKQLAPGTSSHATPRELMHFLLKMEQGKLVDEFSSREIKKLLYLTDRRIRYASSPALADAAVYFKSGSLFGCKPEPGFVCVQYQGNVRNFMNSVAIVETPGRQPALSYLVVVMSNVLRKNSAVAHQTLATRIHRWMQELHPTTQTSQTSQTGPTSR